jgi:glycogen debranching enzyme
VKAIDLGSTAVLRHGALTLVADAFGDLHPDDRGLGLYLGDTRILSSLSLRLDGRRPTLLEADAGGRDAGVVQMTNPELRDDAAKSTDGPTLATQSLGIRRARTLGRAGFEERLVVTNHTLTPLSVTVSVQLDCDGADVFEVRGYHRDRRGTLEPIRVGEQSVAFGYRGLDERTLVTRVRFATPPDRVHAPGPDVDASVEALWRLDIAAGETSELGWRISARWSGAATKLGRLRIRRFAGRDATKPTTRFESDDELLNLVLSRGLEDVRLLETGGPDDGEAFIAAGVPWFATLFGRDALITSSFMLPVAPHYADDALRVLARRQATGYDDWRDAEPGKILHELRTGEMADTGELPFTPYYGSVDATPLWLMLLAETHAWTGDDKLVDELWPHAQAALGWLHGPAMHDGLVQYERRSGRGLANMGWKDSHDAVRDRAGNVTTGPTALIEAQAYAIAADLAMAGLTRRRGDEAGAQALESSAAALAQRVEERYWLPDLGRYAMALDGDGNPADALASNVGHAMWTGLVSREHAAAVARDLAGPRMSSGWGLRTFGAGQPGYNPLGYHIGSVWPHDTAIAVAGLRRYGFDSEAGALATGLLDAARRLPMYRLPELFCGFARADTGVPVQYPVACAPHAWAAASPFMLLRALLGLEADAPNHELRIVRPMLPHPCRKLLVSGLRVGDATVDLLFQAWRGTTGAEVLRREGDLSVVVRL